MRQNTNDYEKFLNYKKFTFISKSIKFLYPIKIVDQFRPNPIYKNFLSLKTVFKIYQIFQRFLFDAIQNLFLQDKKKIKQSDILIISHFVREQQVNMKGDFYFGDLTYFLKKKKISYSKLLINHTNFHSNYLNKNSRISNNYILEKNCNLFTELKIFYLQIKEMLRIILFHRNISSNKLFFLSVIYSLFEHETKFAIRMYFLLKKYLKAINPKFVIFTHEGYPWERLSIKSSKEFNKNIVCVGYQSSILFNKDSQINKKLNGDFNPDMIWTSGIFSERILKNSKKLKKIKVYNVGFFNKKKFKKEKILKLKQCLVLPVGIYSESEMLLKFTLECAKLNKNLNFIWRLHPIINKERIFKNMKLNFDKLPHNIKFSNSTLTDDAKKCSHVLYRSSAAVLEAIKYGCYPLNYKDKKVNDFDVLKNFKTKKYVKSYKELSKIMNKKNAASNYEKLAYKYYKNIYGNVDFKKIFLIIKKKI
jgi:hypothetical protein